MLAIIYTCISITHQLCSEKIYTVSNYGLIMRVLRLQVTLFHFAFVFFPTFGTHFKPQG